MKSYLRDIEHYYVMMTFDSNPHVDTVTMIIKVVEHGKGGRVETTRIIPFGVTRSTMKKEEYDSLDDVIGLMETPGSEFNSGMGEFHRCTSRQGILKWADKFSHFDVEKMIS